MTPTIPEFAAPPMAATEQSVLPPEDQREALRDLVRQCLNDEFDSERRVQIARAQANWLMVQGHHYLAPDFVDDGEGGEIAQLIDATADYEGTRQPIATAVNWLGGDCWKFVAVSGQAAPNCKAVADDPEDPESIRAAKVANANILDLAEKWDVRRKAREIAFHQYTTGPAFLYTSYVSDGDKYGYSEEETVELQPVEGPDGTITEVPVPGAPKQYPNGDVEMRVCNVLEVTVPYGRKNLRECEWISYEYMESKYRLLSLYRNELKEARDDEASDERGTDSQQTAERARSAVQEPRKSGKGKQKNAWLFRRVWLRPFMYEGIKDRQLRESLKASYSTGLRITYVKDKIVALDEERMDDVWAVVKTGRGEYITDNPLCQDMVPIQKADNKFWNLVLESLLRAIPKTLINQNLLDADAWTKNNATPMEVVPVKPLNGEPLDKAVAHLPAARVSDQMMPFREALRQQSQDISGIRPEIAGGGPPTQTYREARQRRDQALMQLGPPSDERNAGLEVAFSNGVKLRAKYGTGLVTRKATQFGETAEAYDMSEIAVDGWHVESDEGFPMSFADRADEMRTYLKEFPPEVQQYLGLMNPANVDAALELLQIYGFKSPMKDERDKIMDTVRRLLMEAPIQQPGPDGMPMEMPTIPPEMGVDNHQFAVEVVKNWCNTQQGRAEAEKNKPGYANVKAYLREQEKAGMMMQMQAAPPPPGGPQGGPPPQNGAPPPPPQSNSPLGVKPEDQDAPLPPLPNGPPPIQ